MAAKIADLLQRNKATSTTHTPLPSIGDFGPGGTPVPKTMISMCLPLPTPPTQETNNLTVTCVDPRCIPEKFFNIQDNEVVVYRNAGGNVRHALRDINIIDTLFSLEELAIVHHTDCGTTHFSEEQVRSNIKSRVDESYWPEIDATVFGANAE